MFAAVLRVRNRPEVTVATTPEPKAKKAEPKKEKDAPVKSESGPDLKALRAEYKKVAGKAPFNGWDAETLKAKLAEKA